jgi:hypothetical protein
VPLSPAQSAQVGYAVFGHHHLHGMLIVIDVRDLRNDGADFPPFAVDGQVKIERYELRVKSPEPPMPFMSCCPMTCVLFTLPGDVDFNRGVDGDQPKPADHFGIVAKLLAAAAPGARNQSQIAVDLARFFVR